MSERTIPPLPDDPDWYEEARHAAEEVAAWLPTTSLPKDAADCKIARMWFHRLAVCMGVIGGRFAESKPFAIVESDAKE